MKKYLSVLFILALSIGAYAQKESTKNNDKKVDTNDLTKQAEMLAKEAFEAHGGEKLKNMKTLSILGSVDITVSAFNQQIPATFATIFSDDKYRLEVNSAFVSFKQVFDGKQTFTSPERGVNLPPINQVGLPLLQKLGDVGFVVTPLADKKKTGFRLTSPQGYYSNFYLDKKTKQIKGYDSSYLVNNVEATTVVEIDKFEDKGGIIIPSKYAQRFNFNEFTVYADFKAKEILVNTEIKNDIFAL